MINTVIHIISGVLSALLFYFVLDKLNYKYKLFKGIQSKINNLHEKKKDSLSLISDVLIMIIIYGIMGTSDINITVLALAFGLLISLKHICFENTLNK